MKHLATVLIFKSDTTREQAANALEQIKGVLDLPRSWLVDPKPTSLNLNCGEKPFEMRDLIFNFGED